MEASTQEKTAAGRVEEIKGVVVDAVFSTDDLPDIYNALEVDIERDGETTTLTCEVQQHLGDDRVRAVAMDATDGLARGARVRDTGGPITVPVGRATLGRIFNLLGDPIDEGDDVETDERWPIHRPAPSVEDLTPTRELLETGIKVIDLLAPYRRGGNDGNTGFDCSGFTRHVFGISLGLALPRRVDEQAGASGLVKVQRNELQPGDLVFFNTLRRTYSHVGIYVGQGRFIHSPRSGAQVRVEDMRTAYWSTRYTGARRAELLAAAAPATGNRIGVTSERTGESMYWPH